MPETEEFVEDPSEITKKIVSIVLKLNEKYESIFKAKSIIKKFSRDIRFRLYLKDGYWEYYNHLKNYKLDKLDLKRLFVEFELLYDKLLFNNYALAYAYSIEKKIENPIITKEDEKMLLLNKLVKKNIAEFKKAFGHYALNAYELSAKRFSEYTDSELFKLAKLAKNIKIKKNMCIDEYLSMKNGKVIPVLITLRELAKYNVLLVVDAIRKELIMLENKHRIKDIFSMNYDNIISLR